MASTPIPMPARPDPLAAAPALGTILLAAWTGLAAAAIPTGFVDETVLSGLNAPVAMTFLPDGRLLFTEQYTGNVRMMVAGKIAKTNPVLTVSNLDIGFFEQGLLGIAVDPGWPTRPYVYFHYDHSPDSKIRISRFTCSGDLNDATGDSLVGDPASRYDLLTDIPDANGNHNGGTLRFGPDGMLYVSLGEDAIPCAAQDTASLRGVILRLDVSHLPAGGGGPPASKSLLTPPGNPFAGPNDNARLAWAIGLRNPFRFHIDPANGDLLIADVGQNSYEEVDWATAGGLNFGWPFREGPAPTAVASCPGVTPVTYTDPIAWYNRVGFRGGASIISGGVYRTPSDTCGAVYPAQYDGDYFYAEYYEGFVRRIKNTGGVWAPAPAVPGQPNATDWASELVSVSDFAVGPEGALWYLRQYTSLGQANTGSIHRILGPNPKVGTPDVTAPADLVLGPTDLISARFTVSNQGSCPRAHAYRLTEALGWVSTASAPLEGITPALAPGGVFALDLQVAAIQPCDDARPDTLVLLAYPAGFPDSARSDTAIYACSTSPVVRFSAFSLAAEAGGVRLRWSLGDPAVTGFHVYRTAAGGPQQAFFRLTSTPIHVAGGPDYDYLDDTAGPGEFYRYYVAAVAGITEFPSAILEITLPLGAFLELGAPRPNPTPSGVALDFRLSRPARVVVTVRDLSGRWVKTVLGAATLAAGLNSAAWDGTDADGRSVPSGLYLIEVEAGTERQSRRIALVR